jgi:hypothetical protein
MTPAKGHQKRWPWYLLLTLVSLGLLVSGAWGLVVHPRLQQSMELHLQQSLQFLVNRVPSGIGSVPPGISFVITQGQINAYLQLHMGEWAPLMKIQVSLQSGVVAESFTDYGVGNTLQFGLSAQRGKLVAQQVKGDGLLTWVETESDLTQLVDAVCSQVSSKLGHPLASARVGTGVIVLGLA